MDEEFSSQIMHLIYHWWETSKKINHCWSFLAASSNQSWSLKVKHQELSYCILFFLAVNTLFLKCLLFDFSDNKYLTPNNHKAIGKWSCGILTITQLVLETGMKNNSYKLVFFIGPIEEKYFCLVIFRWNRVLVKGSSPSLSICVLNPHLLKKIKIKVISWKEKALTHMVFILCSSINWGFFLNLFILHSYPYVFLHNLSI